MESDWTVALAAGDPVMVVPWAATENAGTCRFVDLRIGSHLIDEIEEVQERPLLRSALLLLNGATSQLWTAKCDSWKSSVDDGDAPFDRYEMDAEAGETAFGASSYIDLLSRDAAVFSCFERQERWIRKVKERLRSVSARAARVELVLRHAVVEGVPGFGVTWFVDGCGATARGAEQSWVEAFGLALAVIMDAGFDDAPGDGTIVKTGE
jgi:hypothetical protein